MQVLRVAAVVALSLSAAWCVPLARAKPPKPLPASHPLVGVWRFALPDGSCTETYLIRADGSTLVSSGLERTESAFDISLEPDAQGFYAWTDRIVKTNGKADCGGGISSVGLQSTIYVRMSPKHDRMILCAQATLRNCIGPLVRAEGQQL